MHLLFLFILLLLFSPKALAGINLELARSESEISTTDGKHVYQPRLFIEKRRGLTAFSLDVVAYKPDETEIAYGEIIFRNLGIHLTNVSIGALFGYKHFGPKFVENEFDFSINRGILGGYISYSDSWFLADFSYSSYNPVKSHSSKVDSFELSVSAFPYRKSVLTIGADQFFKVEASVGSLQNLKLYYGIPNFSFEETHKTITFWQGSFQVPLGPGYIGAKIYSHDAADIDEAYKYLGSTVSFEVFKGGSIGYEFPIL